MYLLVGLGNPGPGHAGDRHNIGFMAVDAIVHRHSFGPYRSRFHGRAAEGTIGGETVIALKPATYMNLSGQAVAAAVAYYKLPVERVIVIHDELDLEFGKLRVKLGGGAAGHNGIRSIDGYLGPDFWRVRLGIRHPGDPSEIIGHVLQPFAKNERPTVERLIEAVADAVPLLIGGDPNRFMSKIDVTINPPPPKPPRPSNEDEDNGNDGI